MALAHAAGAHAPLLVNGMGVFVVPIGIHGKLRRNAGQHASLFLLQEKTLHQRVHTGGGAGKDAGGAGWRNGQQVRVAHALRRHLLRQRTPFRRGIAPLFKIGAGLPVAAFKIGVTSFFRRKVRASLHGRAVDAFKHIVRKGQMLAALPPDAALGQHVVVAGHPQPDAAVAPVRQLRIGQRIEI